MTPPKKELWHLDKGIPISVIVTLIAQAVVVVWWFSNLSQQVENTEQRIAAIESQRVSERLTALESQMLDSKTSLVRIENKLDRLIEKAQP